MTNKEFVKRIYPKAKCVHDRSYLMVVIDSESDWYKWNNILSFASKSSVLAWKDAAEIINMQILEKFES